jgi:hypothetical protein
MCVRILGTLTPKNLQKLNSFKTPRGVVLTKEARLRAQPKPSFQKNDILSSGDCLLSSTGDPRDLDWLPALSWVSEGIGIGVQVGSCVYMRVRVYVSVCVCVSKKEYVCTEFVCGRGKVRMCMRACGTTVLSACALTGLTLLLSHSLPPSRAPLAILLVLMLCGFQWSTGINSTQSCM